MNVMEAIVDRYGKYGKSANVESAMLARIRARAAVVSSAPPPVVVHDPDDLGTVDAGDVRVSVRRVLLHGDQLGLEIAVRIGDRKQAIRLRRATAIALLALLGGAVERIK